MDMRDYQRLLWSERDILAREIERNCTKDPDEVATVMRVANYIRAQNCKDVGHTRIDQVPGQVFGSGVCSYCQAEIKIQGKRAA
jgi:ATP-dependent protease ClpP protease subunit